MVTRLFLHSATSSVSGTLPSAEQSSLTAADNFEANQATNRSMSRVKGTSQTTLANSSTATTSLTNYYCARWVSDPINQSGIAANTWTVNVGASTSNTSSNFPTAIGSGNQYANIYVWRPSSGTKIGTINDANTTTTGVGPQTTEKSAICVFTGAAVAGATAGDVIVFELWFTLTQGAATSYTQTLYFDGTTINTTNNATVSNHAAFIETPENITFTDTYFSSKLYLHATTSGLPTGTLPTVEQSTTSTVTSGCNYEGSQTTNRLMNTTKGTSQASLSVASAASASNQTHYISRWVSPVLNQTSIPACSWILNFAVAESSLSANYPCTSSSKVLTQGGNLYVWKPSNGTKVGTIYDNTGTTGATYSEPTVINTETSEHGEFTGSTVAGLTSGDAVLVYEMWQNVSQSSATSFTDTVYYDGTTETLVTGTTVSNHASFIHGQGIELNFGGAPTNFDRPLSTETVSVSESLAEIYNAIRAPAAQTTTISESILRDFDGVRIMSAETNTIGESMTRLKAANRTQTAETVTIGESLARLYNAIRAPSAETIAISEAIAKVQVLVRSLSPETSAISESLTKILTLVRNIPAETNTIGESLARVFVGVRALSDTTAISESLVRLKAAFRSLSDTTAISESLARVFGVVRSLSDTTMIGESLTRVLAAIRALAAQTTAVGESLTKVQTLVRSLVDTTVISETLNRLLAAIRALSAETNAIGESLTKVFTPASGVTAHRPLAAETITISESLARVTTNVRSIIETTIIGESLTRLFNGVRVLVAETTAISESLVSIKTLVRTLTVQTTAISESLTKVVVLVRSLSETTLINETLTRLQVLTRALSTEITIISGSLSASSIKAYVRTLSDTLGISESLTKFAERVRTLSETVIIAEIMSRLQALTRTLTTEISNISDSLLAVTGAFEMALTEVVTITDSLVTAFLHITKGPPLYLTSKFAKVEGVAKPNRSMERESESYVRKQFQKLFRRIYATGRKYRSG